MPLTSVPHGSRSATIHLAVIGAGSWGTTVAVLAAKNTSTMLWARRPELAERINHFRLNPDDLPDFTVLASLRATSSMAEVVREVTPGHPVAVLTAPHLAKEVLASADTVAEGAKSSPSVLEFARRHRVEMPIVERVVPECHERWSARSALGALLQRNRKSEIG